MDANCDGRWWCRAVLSSRINRPCYVRPDKKDSKKKRYILQRFCNTRHFFADRKPIYMFCSSSSSRHHVNWHSVLLPNVNCLLTVSLIFLVYGNGVSPLRVVERQCAKKTAKGQRRCSSDTKWQCKRWLSAANERMTCQLDRHWQWHLAYLLLFNFCWFLLLLFDVVGIVLFLMLVLLFLLHFLLLASLPLH